MDPHALLSFTPVPVQPRHDGWTPERQREFVLALARGAGPAEAARTLGMSPRSAYTLRKRPDAAPFAAAWDAALDFARRIDTLAAAPDAAVAGIGIMLVPRHYRGRLIGFTQREDVHGAMATLRTLDRIADAAVERSGSSRNRAETL